MQSNNPESVELSEVAKKNLSALETLLKVSAPGRAVEAGKLIAEIKEQITFSKKSGPRIGKVLKSMRPDLKKAKQYHAVVKRVAFMTGYTDRAVRNWVDPKADEEFVEKVSSPASAKDVVYRLSKNFYDRTLHKPDKEFDAIMKEVWLTVEYWRNNRLGQTLTISGSPASKYELYSGALTEVSE